MPILLDESVVTVEFVEARVADGCPLLEDIIL